MHMDCPPQVLLTGKASTLRQTVMDTMDSFGDTTIAVNIVIKDNRLGEALKEVVGDFPLGIDEASSE